MSEEPTSLFRRQALQAASEPLWGELLLRSPRIARFAIPLLLLGFVLLGVLLVKGSYVRSESVPGYISPQGGWVRVYPPYEGRILEVLVEEGEQVSADARLVQLVNRRAVGNETYSEDELEAELVEQESTLERELVNEERRQTEEIRWYEQEFTALSARRDILAERVEVLDEQLRLREAALSRATALVASATLARADLETYRETYFAAQATQLGARHELSTLDSTLRKHRLDLKSLPVTQFARRSSLTRELSRVRQQLANLRGQMDYFVTAPVSGTVRGVSIAQGDQVERGRPMFSILVEEADVRAVLLVPSRAIGFVRSGQSVSLKFDAFPHEQFGTTLGRVTEVGRTSLTAEELTRPPPVPGSVYRVYVKPLESEVHAYGTSASLLPGMSLEAEIQLESRSLWQWLTAPLRSVAS